MEAACGRVWISVHQPLSPITRDARTMPARLSCSSFGVEPPTLALRLFAASFVAMFKPNLSDPELLPLRSESLSSTNVTRML